MGKFGGTYFTPMADSNEPKEQTVRIDLPPQSGSKPPGQVTKSRETVRVQLGPRQPSDSPQRFRPLADELPPRTPTEPPPLVSKPAAQVLTSPEGVAAPSAPPPVAILPEALSSGPKKETARVARMPDSPSKPVSTVQMKKTQPLIAMPHAAPRSTSIAVAPEEKSAMPLCWALLGVSAVILIIQIWTYFS